MLTAIGSGIWNAIFIGLGWYLQRNYEVLDKWLGPVSYVALGLIAGGLGWLGLRRLSGELRDRVERSCSVDCTSSRGYQDWPRWWRRSWNSGGRHSRSWDGWKPGRGRPQRRGKESA